MDRKRIRAQTRARQQKFRAIKKLQRNVISTACHENSDNETENDKFLSANEHVNQEFCSEQHIDQAISNTANIESNEESQSESDQSSTNVGIIETHTSSETTAGSETSSTTEDNLSNLGDDDNDNISNYSDSQDDEVLEVNEIRELRKWAIEAKIPHVHLAKLLLILRQRLLPDLPSSSSTFLRTSSAKYCIEKMRDSNSNSFGEFVYFGIGKGLQSCINTAAHIQSNIIELQINIDGLPLFKSSAKNFWPILCKIQNNPDIYQPFVVAMYSGDSKPKYLEEFLRKFVDGLNQLQQEGIHISERHFAVQLKCFLCDTPARAFIKCVKGHGGYNACERCEVHGQRVDKTMVYSFDGARKRTDLSFRSYSQPEHHNGVSPLLRIEPPIDMIRCILLDFLHLGCHGAMKKLAESWHSGDLNVKMGPRDREELSRRMESLSTHVPSDFPRKPRSTRFLAKFKATEFRFLLLYCGPIVLKDILNKDLYDHFLLLHVSFRILSSEELLQKYEDQAKQYLKSFCLTLTDLYGPKALVMNMHNLIHIAADVDFMDCNLSKMTTFPFENYLGTMKKFIRSGNRPLAQFCRRYHESNIQNNRRADIPPMIQVILQDTEQNISKIKLKDLVLSDRAPDNVVMMHDKTILEIKQMFFDNRLLVIKGCKWNVKKPIYEYPCNSKSLNMWQLCDKPSLGILSYNSDDILHKLVKLCLSFKPQGNQKVFVIPILH